MDDFEPSLWGLILSNFSLLGTKGAGGDRGDKQVGRINPPFLLF